MLTCLVVFATPPPKYCNSCALFKSELTARHHSARTFLEMGDTFLGKTPESNFCINKASLEELMQPQYDRIVFFRHT